MKKLLLSGICLLTHISSPLYGASRAQQEYAAQLAAAQAILDLAELDLLIQADRDFFISMMQTENINREEQIASALNRDERTALSTIAQALLGMNTERTIQLSVADNDTIRTYINPPKAPFIAAPEKPISGPKEGSHEWHLAMLREELRTRLHSLGAAARDVTIEAYEKLLKEKDAALKAIQKKITMASSKDKKKVEAQNASEKSALNAFVQELRTTLIDLKNKAGQALTQNRMQEKAARPMAAAPTLERKVTTDIDRYYELEDEINNLPKEKSIKNLKKYAALVTEKDALVANSPKLQQHVAKESEKALARIQEQITSIRASITPQNVIPVRNTIMNMVYNLNPDFLDYPKDDKKEQIDDMLNKMLVDEETLIINTNISIANLRSMQNLSPELDVLRNMLIVFLETGSEQRPVTGQEISGLFDMVNQRLFPEEQIKVFKEVVLQQKPKQPQVVPSTLEKLQNSTTTILTLLTPINPSNLPLQTRLELATQVGNAIETLQRELARESEIDIMASNAVLDHIQNTLIVYQDDNNTVNVPSTITALNGLRALTPIMNLARDLLIAHLRITLNPTRPQIEDAITTLKVPQNRR